MPLIDLKTDLKSLKYGKDQPNGGDSGQPYITTDIDGNHGTQVNFPNNSILGLFGLGLNSLPLLPNLSTSLNRSRIGRLVNDLTSGDDFIRGGALGAAQASINDAFRIGSFFLSLPKGPIFIAKQVGLQLSNPLLEVKKGGRGLINGALNLSPGSLLGTITGGMLGTNRIYNLGINTLAQVPVNAFGIHFNRHGLLPVQDDTNKYLAIVQSNNKGNGANNRLVKYANKLLPQTQPQPTGALKLLQSVLSLIPGASNFITPQQQMIDQYVGGPGSVYGIGKTFIRRYDYTNNGVNKQQPQEKGVVNYINTLGVSSDYFTINYNNDAVTGYNNISNNGNQINHPVAVTYKSNTSVGKYFDLQNKIEEQSRITGLYSGSISTKSNQ
jgi:hypothetical protein